MSFILDALKKAESERNRASGPVLVDVRIAPPRRRLPAWAWVIGGVLLANLSVLAWMMFHRPAPSARTAASPPAAVAPATPDPTPAMAPSAPVPASSTEATTQTVPTQTPVPSPQIPVTQPTDVRRLPTARELQASGVSLPPLLMNLHAYDPTPSLRYVLLNGMRLTEGEFTPDGIKVETIVEGGVVLEARGQRFLLPTGI